MVERQTGMTPSLRPQRDVDKGVGQTERGRVWEWCGVLPLFNQWSVSSRPGIDSTGT